MLFDDLQSIQSGLSGFGSEIVQFQKALAEVEQGYSLFLLDEFARGTNPDEGAIIVQAVTRYLNDVNAISLLTTHYDKVAEHARIHYQIIGLRDVDPPGAGRYQRGRRGRHRPAHELWSVPGGGQVRLPPGRAEYLPDAVAEAGNSGKDRAELLILLRGEMSVQRGHFPLCAISSPALYPKETGCEKFVRCAKKLL